MRAYAAILQSGQDSCLWENKDTVMGCKQTTLVKVSSEAKFPVQLKGNSRNLILLHWKGKEKTQQYPGLWRQLSPGSTFQRRGHYPTKELKNWVMQPTLTCSFSWRGSFLLLMKFCKKIQQEHTHAHIKEHAQIQQTPAQNRIIPLSNSVPVKVVDVVKYIVSGHTENGNWPGEAWHHISVPAWLGWILAGSGSGRWCATRGICCLWTQNLAMHWSRTAVETSQVFIYYQFGSTTTAS